MKLAIREFSTAIRPHLEAIGLKKRAGDFYTIDESDAFLGVVGLGRATEHGALRIWPTVGVRHQQTERLLADLLGRKPHLYAPATIGCGLGYLMPEGRWMEWIVEDASAVEVRARDVADAIRTSGLPAIRSNASLASVLVSLTARRAMTSLRDEYVRPVVLAELGRHEEAADGVARQVDARRARADAGANQYRAFAEAFAVWQERAS